MPQATARSRCHSALFGSALARRSVMVRPSLRHCHPETAKRDAKRRGAKIYERSQRLRGQRRRDVLVHRLSPAESARTEAASSRHGKGFAQCRNPETGGRKDQRPAAGAASGGGTSGPPAFPAAISRVPRGLTGGLFRQARPQSAYGLEESSLLPCLSRDGSRK
jgi:hypothetical protein